MLSGLLLVVYSKLLSGIDFYIPIILIIHGPNLQWPVCISLYKVIFTNSHWWVEVEACFIFPCGNEDVCWPGEDGH